MGVKRISLSMTHSLTHSDAFLLIFSKAGDPNMGCLEVGVFGRYRVGETVVF